MKRTILAFGIAFAVLLTTAGCGGMDKNDQTAVDSISSSFAGKSPTKANQKVADCFGNKLVSEAGVDQLKKDKVIDKDFKAAKTIPQKLSKTTAEAYADGIVGCIDYNALKPDIKKQSGATDAQVSAYVACIDAIDDGDLKQSIVDGYTKTTQSAVSKKVQAASTACQKKIGG